MRSISIAVVVFFSVGFVGDECESLVIETVTVGNPGNPNDTHGDGYGGVEYVYNIGKFEVTAGQYTVFLNAVAGDDTYGLYNTEMWSDSYGCKIQRTGLSPNYDYSVAADWADRPVNYVSWGDVARFANWLHNGQPTGNQDLTTTEDGSYYLNGATSSAALLAVVRELDATWVIPSEDEWYKAAYCDGGASVYYDYPTSTDSVPSNDLIDPDPGNNANFYYAHYTIGSPYYRTVVGDFENSESPYGTFDQGGNVWEWNEAVIGSYRGLRGGSATGDAHLHVDYRDSVNPTLESGGIGFRVALMPLGACCTVHGCEYTTEAECNELDDAKYNGDGSTCEEACPAGIPTVTSWGLLAMTLLVLAAGTVVVRRRVAV